LLVLSMFFAASILVHGAFNFVGALRNRDKDGWWIMLLIGLLGLAVGAVALLNPPVSMRAFVLLAAIQAIALGVFLLMLGYKLRRAISREWVLYLTVRHPRRAAAAARRPVDRLRDRQLGGGDRRAGAVLRVQSPQPGGPGRHAPVPLGGRGRHPGGARAPDERSIGGRCLRA
jgi:Short repeat of unknown function (DUF308)